MKDRSRATALAAEHQKRQDPVGWFEALYKEASGNESIIPWADGEPNPLLVDWWLQTKYAFAGKRCIVIGCGLGDDAEYLAAQGGEVTAFDVSPTAIAWCRDRFPNSKVNYVVGDLFSPAPEWVGGADFVLEINTIQALPLEVREETIKAVTRLVKADGHLLVICRAREPQDPFEAVPIPLTMADLDRIAAEGFTRLSLDDSVDSEDPPVRRFRAFFRRKS